MFLHGIIKTKLNPFSNNTYQFQKDRLRNRRVVELTVVLGISRDGDRFVEWNIGI